MRRQRPVAIRKSRTTLSLPSDSLGEARRIARARKVSVSAVVSEALREGLRLQTAAERSEAVLASYRQAFSGFSDEEIATLDGIILEPTQSH